MLGSEMNGTPAMATDRARILVVEDNAAARRVLAALLRAEGYAVATAADGGEALDLLRRGGPPLAVLLDLSMPGVDGWQFAPDQQMPGLVGAVMARDAKKATALWLAHPYMATAMRDPAVATRLRELAARNEHFPDHEKANPEMEAWTDRFVRKLLHAPGSPNLAQRIHSAMAK